MVLTRLPGTLFRGGSIDSAWPLPAPDAGRPKQRAW
jgi:hypothetical protein